MTPEAFLVTAIAVYIVGGILSILVPFARKYFSGEAEKFQWRKAGGRILAVLLAAGPTLIGAAQIAEFKELAEQGWIGVALALVTGLISFGASSLGHQTQRTPAAIKAYRSDK